MRFWSILAVAAVSAPVVSGVISNIAVPETIKSGEGFNIRILAEPYIQSVYDVAVAVGIAPGDGFPGSLDQVLGSYYLGPEQSNVHYNITKWVPLPPSTGMGRVTITAGIYSLWGAGAYPLVTTYIVQVTVGDQTSNNYILGHRS